MEIVKLAMDAGERQFGVKSKLILCSIVGLWDYAVPIAHMAVKYRDYVCGVDVAGYENGHVYKTRKEKQQIEAFKIARENGISRTAHAGEAPHAGGPTSIQNVSIKFVCLFLKNFIQNFKQSNKNLYTVYKFLSIV